MIPSNRPPKVVRYPAPSGRTKTVRQKNMERIAILLAGLLSVSCAVDQRCDQVCTALRSVRPDAEGYFPREAVFNAAGISETDLNPLSMTPGGGHAALDCGCLFEFTVRHLVAVPAPKTLDDILNNPNRTAFKPSSQLESVVLVDKRSRVIFRMESPASRRKRVAE
jgi:hypothetical protein